MRVDHNIGTLKADNLFIDEKFPVDAVGIIIASGEGLLSRGTVVAMNETTGKSVILGTTPSGGEILTPYGIICDDVDATSADTFTMVFRSGHFNRNALIVEENYEMTSKDESALRNGGIYLSNAM